jgi:hypothetical protein
LKKNNEEISYLIEDGIIKVSANFTIQKIEVFDIGGKLIYKAFPKQKIFELNQSLNSGVYIINSTNKMGITKSNKIALTTLK